MSNRNNNPYHQNIGNGHQHQLNSYPSSANGHSDASFAPYDSVGQNIPGLHGPMSTHSHRNGSPNMTEPFIPRNSFQSPQSSQFSPMQPQFRPSNTMSSPQHPDPFVLNNGYQQNTNVSPNRYAQYTPNIAPFQNNFHQQNNLNGAVNYTNNWAGYQGVENIPGVGQLSHNPMQYILSEELLADIQSSKNSRALLEIQIGLEQLVIEPEFFDTWSNVVKDRLLGRDFVESSPDLSIAVSILIEMAVVIDGNQYDFSKLCKILCTNLEGFSSILLERISDFTASVSEILSDNQHRNLLLFLAELYDKFEIDGAKSPVLSKAIFDQLLVVLKIEPLTDRTLSAIIQTLKLTGRFLEVHFKSQQMSALIEQLCARSCANSALLSESSKTKIDKLVKLRNEDWGIVNQEDQNPNKSDSSFGENQLTDEEQAFIEANLEEVENIKEASGSILIPEEEVEEEYEKFLAATAINAAEKALERGSVDEDDEKSAVPIKEFGKLMNSSD